MIQQIIGRAGILRDVQNTGFIIGDNSVLMRGPKGGLLAVSKDGQYVLELVTAEDIRAHESGQSPAALAIFRVAPGPTSTVGRVVDMSGNRYPDTPTTITDPKTGQVIEEETLRAQIAAAGGEVSGGGLTTQHYLLLGGLALLWFYSRKRR